MFRFTIRDVLWLTALVALGASWWVDRTPLARALLETEERAIVSERKLVAANAERSNLILFEQRYYRLHTLFEKAAADRKLTLVQNERGYFLIDNYPPAGP